VKSACLVVAAMIFATTASAEGAGRYTASLAQPLTVKKEFIVNGNIWQCEAANCILTSVAEGAGDLRNCRALQRQAGALSAYGSEKKPFSAEQLAKCNAKG
jgi:hypothetical protein